MQEEHGTTDHEKKDELFGYICRMKDNRLVKEGMFGTKDGETRRRRPCQEWLDNIKECGGEEIHRKAGMRRTVVQTALDTYGS